MKISASLASAVAVCFFLFLSSPAFCRQSPGVLGKQCSYIMSVNAGTNLLQSGFPSYGSSPYFGADFYIPQGSLGGHWWSRYAWRVSVDYFPMVLPAGVYGTTEDMFDIALSQVFFFPVNDSCTSSLFAGIGFGGYADWIRIDTPATGARSNISYSPGVSLSAGWGYKISNSLELVPEARAHFVYASREYFTVNTSIHLGVAWWFNQ
ncbi:MAG: hypothetical protein WCG51_00820 [Elusimicrobiota bacterium]